MAGNSSLGVHPRCRLSFMARDIKSGTQNKWEGGRDMKEVIEERKREEECKVNKRK